jgi:hypothetical protein
MGAAMTPATCAVTGTLPAARRRFGPLHQPTAEAAEHKAAQRVGVAACGARPLTIEAGQVAEGDVFDVDGDLVFALLAPHPAAGVTGGLTRIARTAKFPRDAAAVPVSGGMPTEEGRSRLAR